MTQTIEQLTARVRELEEENARLKAECDDIKQVQFPRKLEAVAVGWKKQLAAEQLNNKLLRDALIATRDDLELRMRLTEDDSLNISNSVLDQMLDAIDIPASTEALDKYVAEKVKDVQLQDIEQYLLQMAGISTAAIGYWKEDDSIPPDYDTPALRDVAKLYANYESRTKQRDLAVEAMREALECGEDGDWQSARRILATAIKESEAK